MSDRIEAGNLQWRIRGQAENRTAAEYFELVESVHRALRKFCTACGAAWHHADVSMQRSGSEHFRKLVMMVIAHKTQSRSVRELPFFIDKMEHKVIDDILSATEALRQLTERVDNVVDVEYQE